MKERYKSWALNFPEKRIHTISTSNSSSTSSSHTLFSSLLCSHQWLTIRSPSPPASGPLSSLLLMAVPPACSPPASSNPLIWSRYSTSFILCCSPPSFRFSLLLFPKHQMSMAFFNCCFQSNAFVFMGFSLLLPCSASLRCEFNLVKARLPRLREPCLRRRVLVRFTRFVPFNLLKTFLFPYFYGLLIILSLNCCCCYYYYFAYIECIDR